MGQNIVTDRVCREDQSALSLTPWSAGFSLNNQKNSTLYLLGAEQDSVRTALFQGLEPRLSSVGPPEGIVRGLQRPPTPSQSDKPSDMLRFAPSIDFGIDFGDRRLGPTREGREGGMGSWSVHSTLEPVWPILAGTYSAPGFDHWRRAGLPPTPLPRSPRLLALLTSSPLLDNWGKAPRRSSEMGNFDVVAPAPASEHSLGGDSMSSRDRWRRSRIRSAGRREGSRCWGRHRTH